MSLISSKFSATPQQSFELDITVSDPDGDVLDVIPINAPHWATFSSYQSGGTHHAVLSGIPTFDDEGVYPDIQIVANDGSSSTSTPPFEISVGVPTIEMLTTTLATLPDTYIAVTAVARHPSGKPLQVSIENAPPWSSFWSFDTGGQYYMALYGTPQTSDVGVYSGIRFTASDGKLTTTQHVELAVAIGVTRTVSLSWLQPTENENGTPLLDLAGYSVYAWRPQEPPRRLSSHPSYVTGFEISDLPVGVWMFGVTASNSAGIESRLSRVVPVLVEDPIPTANSMF